MKKFIAILLVVTMIFSTSAMMSFAAEDSFTVAVASDLHYVSGTMSEAIIDAFLKQISAKSDVTEVILSGDLTDSGSEEEAKALAEKLSAFETAYNKQVYVVPGNHDVNDATKSQFMSIYKNFGYSEALNRDSLSASYTVDINDDYRLLCIDTTAEKSSGYALDAERVEWIKAQCEQAKNDKKHVIAVMHHNMLQHFAFDFIHEGSVIDESLGLKEIFAEYDVKYTFSGHTHAQDIMQYEGANGDVNYEVVNASLSAYPVAYMLVEFSDSAVDFKTESIASIEVSVLEALGLDEDSIRHAKADFKGYSQVKYRESVKALFSDKLCTETIKEYLGVTYENNQNVALIIDKVGAKLEEVLHMPLYNKDKGEVSVNVQAVDENGALLYNEDNEPVMVARYSVQEITESYGGILPESTYKDLLDVIVLLYESHVSGSAGLTMSSDEYFITVHGFAAALNYCLYSISEGEYGILIQFIADKFEPTLLGKVPSSIYTYMAGGKYGFEQNLLFMAYLVSPFVKNVVSDSIPSDRNLTLGAYKAFAQDTPAEPENPDNSTEPEAPAEDNSFRAKFVAFFDKIADFFRMIFKVFTFQSF